METSNKTAREIWAEIKANPKRARFGYGRKAVLVNIDFNSEANLGKTKDRNRRLKTLLEDFNKPLNP